MDRRMFLAGAGTSLCLPWLPSAFPARAAVAAPPRRLLYWFVPNGLLTEYLKPTIVGPNYDLPFVLESLAPLQSRISVINGIHNLASGSELASTHEVCTASLLTDKQVTNTYSGTLDADVSVDQFAANALGAVTPFRSLVLGTGEPPIAFGGNIEVLYSHISWAAPATPIAPIDRPRTLFDLLFAGSDPDATEEEQERRERLRKSVLDAVLERTSALEKKLDATDRAKLDQFTTGVRELEVRIDMAVECTPPEAPAEELGFQATVAAMNDLLVLAFQCDYTRVASFMLGPTTATTSYAFLGPTLDAHTLSHNGAYYESDRGELLTVQNWQVAQWVDLCTKLAAVEQEDGTDLLSSSLVHLVTEFSDSGLHVGIPLTMLLAGGEAGGVLQGQHRLYTGGRPHVDVLAAGLEFVGVDSAGFGHNGTGPVDLSV